MITSLTAYKQARSHLPHLPPLIGREAAVRDIMAVLRQTPLLTLTGPGGSGKTRMALHLAQLVEPNYRDGIAVASLADITDPKLVVESVAATLGVKEGLGESLLHSLASALRERELLLVLDNCEQVVGECAELAEALLQACPHLRILATSRENLRIEYESIWPVPPLELPDPATEADLDALASCGAVALFVQRARAAAPSFLLTAENAGQVVAICQQVDGLPLAIELAAARIRVLAPGQLLERLEAGLDVLAGGKRTVLPRYQTIQDTIAWSYHLLTADEQALFRRLAICAGSFGLDVVEALAADQPWQAEALDILTRLIDKSLVVVTSSPAGARYRILLTLRQFGASQLSLLGEMDACHAMYGGWLGRLSRRVMREFARQERSDALEPLERERDHLRAVLHWWLSHERAPEAVQLMVDLVEFWCACDLLHEGKRWLSQALELDDGSLPSAARARALTGLGQLTVWQGDYVQAQSALDAARVLVEDGGDPQSIAWVRLWLGLLAEKRGAYAEAEDLLRTSLRLFQMQGDAANADLARHRLGIVVYNQGDFAQARDLLEATLHFQRTQEPSCHLAWTLLNYGAILLEHGEHERGLALLQECLMRSRFMHQQMLSAYALFNLGFGAFERGEYPQAQAYFQEALTLQKADGARAMVLRLVDGVASVAARLGDIRYAARLWGAIESKSALFRQNYLAREWEMHEREVAACRDQANADIFATAWAEGAMLSVEEMLAAAGEPMHLPERATHSRMALPAAVPELCITALGPVRILLDGQLLTTQQLRYTKARECLLFLLENAPRTKEQIELALWPDADPEHVGAQLRVLLYHLRRALGSAPWIEHHDVFYQFNRALPHVYDVETFTMHLAQARQMQANDPAGAVVALEAATVLYRGDFGEGLLLSDWVAQRQDMLRRQFEDGLLLLGQLRLALDAPRAALEAFFQLIARDHYVEAAHQGIIRCYLRLNERGQAAQHYAYLRRMFADELGIMPTPETAALLS